MVYHIGICKQGKTMVIQATQNIDSLSCETYDYLGQRITTKADLKHKRYFILRLMQQRRPEVYGNLKYAIVE